MIRVLIAADAPVERGALAARLAREPTLTVVGVAPADDALVDEIEAREPDVVLLASGDPERLTSALSPDAAARAPAFVVLADAPTARTAARAIRAGARSVLPREASADELLAALEAAAAGLVAVRGELAADLLGGGAARATRAEAERAAAPPLSPRELEILALLAEGMANKVIAARLGISEHTVKTHVAAILERLHAETRAEAVAIGARRGLILL